MTRSSSLLCIAAPALVVSLACHEPELPVPSALELVWQFDCPQDSVDIKLVGTSLGGKDTVAAQIHDIPLSEPVTNIPEYHDCQRFLTGSGGLGSTYAVFVAFRLDHVVLGPAAVPVATIYTPNGVYDYLGIKPGFNCLFLMNSGGAWAASMVPRGQGDSKKNCGDPGINPTSPESKKLRVIATNYGGQFNPEDFPPVARWDYDTSHSKHYVGVRCGAAWCEVGDTDLTPSPGFAGGLSFPSLQNTRASWASRVQTVKGWYDAQRLSVLVSGSVVPSDVHAVLVPAPALDSINWISWPRPDSGLKYYTNTWVHVAYTVLDGDYPKWNFKHGINKISLCYGGKNANACSIPDPPPPLEATFATALDACSPDPTNDQWRWWARTESDVNNDGTPKATTTVTYSCVRRMDHRGGLLAWEQGHPNMSYTIPGTARWFFLPNDESAWTGCPTGCCTKQ